MRTTTARTIAALGVLAALGGACGSDDTAVADNTTAAAAEDHSEQIAALRAEIIAEGLATDEEMTFFEEDWLTSGTVTSAEFVAYLETVLVEGEIDLSPPDRGGRHGNKGFAG